MTVLTTILTLLLILAACGTTPEDTYDDAIPPPIGMPAPTININGRLYHIHGRWGEGLELLDDSFTYIGEVQSYTETNIGPWDRNLQANYSNYLGAVLYHSGDNLIISLNGDYTLFKFRGRKVPNWVSQE